LEDRNFDALVDAKLQNDYEPNEMACMVACAAACVRHSARRRPRMSQVESKLQFLIALFICLLGQVYQIVFILGIGALESLV
jgi:hypothetical protein